MPSMNCERLFTPHLKSPIRVRHIWSRFVCWGLAHGSSRRLLLAETSRCLEISWSFKKPSIAFQMVGWKWPMVAEKALFHPVKTHKLVAYQRFKDCIRARFHSSSCSSYMNRCLNMSQNVIFGPLPH